MHPFRAPGITTPGTIGAIGAAAPARTAAGRPRDRRYSRSAREHIA
jgi:hypothetical protein